MGDEGLRISSLRAWGEQRLLKLPPARSIVAKDEIMSWRELIEHETRQYVGTSM